MSDVISFTPRDVQPSRAQLIETIHELENETVNLREIIADQAIELSTLKRALRLA